MRRPSVPGVGGALCSGKSYHHAYIMFRSNHEPYKLLEKKTLNESSEVSVISVVLLHDGKLK